MNKPKAYKFTAYILLFLLTLWGVIWSFYRHGSVHGFFSLTAWPYAWYRGVAAIWEEPKWKEEWDRNTLHIAILIETFHHDSETPPQHVDLSNLSKITRKWILDLPLEKRKNLELAAESYNNAIEAHSHELINLLDQLLKSKQSKKLKSMESYSKIDLEHAESILKHVQHFQHIEGFRRIWDKRTKAREGEYEMLRNYLKERDFETDQEFLTDLKNRKDELEISMELTKQQIAEELHGLFSTNTKTED